MKEKIKGLLLCLVIAVPAWLLGRKFAVVGGPVISILLGMIVGMFIKNRAPFDAGIKFTSKKILQWAVILLGFGMNLTVIGQTGVQSLPIILSTITTSLLVAFILCKALKIPSKISTLVGVGSSICGGSAIAATAPVIDASDEEVAQAISVIFFYNVIAALVFPLMGTLLGFSTTSGEAFGIFAGTAVNDTSSVTAAEGKTKGYSLEPVEAIQPTSVEWERGSTTEEVRKVQSRMGCIGLYARQQLQARQHGAL